MPWTHPGLITVTYFVGLPLKVAITWQFQVVHNIAAPVLLGVAKFHHEIALWLELHWLPLAFRAQFKVLVITSKAIYSLGQGYLKDYIHLCSL